ncbi:MAG: metallophosphoesterase [Pseudomonadota bacterium]
MPKICVVADIHHGAPSFTKNGPAAAALMQGFAAFCAAEAPDLVVDLGDRISDVDAATDLRLEREAAAMFAPIAQPVKHICGNHDLDHLTVAQNEEILGQSLAHETVALDGWTAVMWRPDARIRRPGGFVLPEADFLWLAGTLAAATGPTAVFSHVPVSGHDQAGNYYFQNNPDVSTYPGGAERVRAELSRMAHPLVWISGHVHWNTVTFVGGRPHVTLQSLTETFTTHPETAGSYGMLELGEEIAWTVHGRDAFAFRVPAAQAARRWATPLPPFAEHPEIRERLRAQAAE